MTQPKHIRIKDIAEKAGCSIGTVDRVIHNRGKVSEAVRKRVLEIIWELPTAGMKKALDRYREQGYQIQVVEHSYHNPEQFYQAGMKMLPENIDGVIMSPATYKESVRLARTYFQEGLPFILIDSDIQGPDSPGHQAHSGQEGCLGDPYRQEPEPDVCLPGQGERIYELFLQQVFA